MTETVPERIWVNLNSANRGDFIEWEAYDERGGNLMRSVPFVPATALEAAQARERELENAALKYLADAGQLADAIDTARREALEEAAKVAEVWVKRAMHLSPNGYEIERSHGHMAKAASDEIRALMEKPNDQP